MLELENISDFFSEALESMENFFAGASEAIGSFMYKGILTSSLVIPALILIYAIMMIVFRRWRPWDIAVSFLFLIWAVVFDHLKSVEGINLDALYAIWAASAAFYASFASFAVMWFKAMHPKFKPSPFYLIHEKLFEIFIGPKKIEELKVKYSYRALAEKYNTLQDEYNKIVRMYRSVGEGLRHGQTDGIDYVHEYRRMKENLKGLEPQIQSVISENNKLKKENTRLKAELEKYRPEEQVQDEKVESFDEQ